MPKQLPIKVTFIKHFIAGELTDIRMHGTLHFISVQGVKQWQEGMKNMLEAGFIDFEIHDLEIEELQMGEVA